MMSRPRFALLGTLLLALALPPLPFKGARAQEAPAEGLQRLQGAEGQAAAGAGLQVKSTHGDWEVLCGKTAAAEGEQCFMAQGVSARQTNQAILAAMVLKPQGEPPLLRLTLPLGILLPRGLSFAIDDAKIGEVPFLYCLSDGCVTQVTLEDDVIAKLKGGREATATIRRADDQPIDVPISLAGFTAAYGAL